MNRNIDLALTALAPMIWGSSYIVATQFLPGFDPLAVAFLRALPTGLLLLLFVRQLPTGQWIPKMLVLGALNFSVFWSLLFIAAYRLPGGVAAILGAVQPFIVIFAARGLLGTPIRAFSLIAVLTGATGVAMLILTPSAKLDTLGVIAGLGGAASMALGTVLSRKWQPPVSALTFTAWQLTAGGFLLLPVLPFTTMQWSAISGTNLVGLAYLGVIGAGLTYVLWLRGVRKLQPSAVSILGFLSPLSAAVLGWLILDETLSPLQCLGMAVVLVSVFIGQWALKPRPSVQKPRQAEPMQTR